jgi:hypothetical protein
VSVKVITQLVWPLLTLLVEKDGHKNVEGFLKNCHQSLWQLSAAAEKCAERSAKSSAPRKGENSIGKNTLF